MNYKNHSQGDNTLHTNIAMISNCFNRKIFLLCLLFLLDSYITLSKEFLLDYPNIPKVLHSRRFFPLLNNYSINVKPCNHDNNIRCGDFNIVIYFISSKGIQVIVRRFDELNWSFTFYLLVYDINGYNYVNISINPSNQSVYQKLYNITNITIIPNQSMYQTQKIPKMIIQTAANYQSKNEYHWNAYMSFVDLNPEYKLMLYIDEDCRKLIKNFFPNKVLDAYDQLIPTAFKADLFRYCFLYIYGGCYFDNKMIARQPLRQIIQSNDELILCSDALLHGFTADSIHTTTKIYNAVMCSIPGDNRMLKAIEYAVNLILDKYYPIVNYLGSDLTLTGPIALYNSIIKYINESNLRLKHGIKRFTKTYKHRNYLDYYVINKYNNEIAFTKTYKSYYNKIINSNGGNYHQQWDHHEIYYNKPIWLYIYKILFNYNIISLYNIIIQSNSTITLQLRSLLLGWIDKHIIEVNVYCHLPKQWININNDMNKCNQSNSNYTKYITSISIINDISNLQVIIPIYIPNEYYNEIILYFNLNNSF